MTPPAGNDNPTPQEPTIDTQRMFREMAERENPRKAAEEAAKLAIEQRQKQEERQVKTQHEKGRAAVAATAGAARAELTTEASPPTPPAAPQTTPQAVPPSAPQPATPPTVPTTTPQTTPQPAAAPPAAPSAAPQATPAAAPTSPETNPQAPQTPETPPTTPPATPPETPPASPPTTPPETPPTTPPTTPPPAPGSLGAQYAKFKEFFGKLWEGIAAAVGTLTGKLTDMWKGITSKFTASTPATPPAAPGTTPAPTPAPAPGVTPPSGPPPSPEVASGNARQVIATEATRLGIEPAFAYAIVAVESGKKGLNENGTPVIRFEPHVFNKYVEGRHGKWGASTLIGRQVDGVSCEGGQANEHACFRKAMEINRDAAFKSMSMGQGQVMGFNAGLAGYSSAETMYNDFSASGGGEVAQIKAMFKLIAKSPDHLRAARNNDFSAFARYYNGAKVGTAKHMHYSAALENAYRKNGGGQSPRTKKPDEAVA